ncbi:MAG: hypothetical protein KDD62_09035, partial [Bdellovibrionales bacterium]|nr:hypothetical protein [Bdellovibrionales bacterium]
ERLSTPNKGTLFKDANGNNVWVRGSAPGVALHSYPSYGVRVDSIYDGSRDGPVAFAPSVPARIKKS